MTPTAFESLRIQMNDACEVLRGFTLGRHGHSQKAGVAAIKRLSALCDSLAEAAVDPWHGRTAKFIFAQGRGRIKAAEARLALLKAKH